MPPLTASSSGVPISSTRRLPQRDDAVDRRDRREPVGDDERRPARHELVKPGLYLSLGFGVQRARGLVQHEDGRVLVQRAGDRDALLLPSGQLEAALADLGVVGQREPLDERLDVGAARGLPRSRARRRGSGRRTRCSP